MKNEKGQKELIKELNQLIKQYPEALVVLVDTKNGHIYLSIEDFVREYSVAELESMKDDFDIYPAIVIITEADV